MVEDLAIIHFEDFAFGIGNQHVVTAHIGPVAAGVRRRQVTLLPLFNVVFRGEVHRRNGVADVKLGEIGGEFFQRILIDPRGSSRPVGASGGKKYAQKHVQAGRSDLICPRRGAGQF